MDTLTGRQPGRLSTQTATVVQLLAMVDEDPGRRRICHKCWVEKPRRASHTCRE